MRLTYRECTGLIRTGWRPLLRVVAKGPEGYPSTTDQRLRCMITHLGGPQPEYKYFWEAREAHFSEASPNGPKIILKAFGEGSSLRFEKPRSDARCIEIDVYRAFYIDTAACHGWSFREKSSCQVSQRHLLWEFAGNISWAAVFRCSGDLRLPTPFCVVTYTSRTRPDSPRTPVVG